MASFRPLLTTPGRETGAVAGRLDDSPKMRNFHVPFG